MSTDAGPIHATFQAFVHNVTAGGPFVVDGRPCAWSYHVHQVPAAGEWVTIEAKNFTVTAVQWLLAPDTPTAIGAPKPGGVAVVTMTHRPNEDPPSALRPQGGQLVVVDDDDDGEYWSTEGPPPELFAPCGGCRAARFLCECPGGPT